MVQSDGTTITDSFSYDAYGVMLGGNPTSAPATSLLYAGEQFDVDAQMYYNRARYYDQNTGRFNRMDPFGGSTQDPQSLHKYLYCHANPVNNIDPTGQFTLFGISFATAIQSLMRGIRTLGLVETIRWTANAIVGGLVGWDIYQGLKNNDATLDAGTIGVAISGGTLKSPFGGAVNPEIVIGSGSKHNFAIFVGFGPTTNNTWSVAPYVGVAFNTPRSKEYKGWCRSITLSLNMLPRRWRSLIKEKVENFLPRLQQAFMIRQGDIGQVAENLNPQIVAKASSVLSQGLSKGISGSSVTFWGAQGGNGFGITFAPGLPWSRGSRSLSVSYQYYHQFWPGNNVNFQE